MSNNTRKKNISTLIILAIVLLVPGFLYIALNKIGSNTYLKLPIYGEKSLSGKMVRKMGREMPDTVFHEIQPRSFMGADGDSVQFLGLDSVVYVAHLIYTKDEGLSKAMLSALHPVVQRFKNNKKVHFYSISVDAKDSADMLAELASGYRKGLEQQWDFIASSSLDLINIAQQELLLDALADPADSNKFVISNNYILIDSKHRIRGFYDINLKSELDRMEDEIKVQLVEEIRNNPLKIERK